MSKPTPDHTVLAHALSALNADDAVAISHNLTAKAEIHPHEADPVPWEPCWSIECDSGGVWSLVGRGACSASGWGKCVAHYPIADPSRWPIQLEIEVESRSNSSSAAITYAQLLERAGIVASINGGDPAVPSVHTLAECAEALVAAADHLRDAAEWSSERNYEPSEALDKAMQTVLTVRENLGWA